MKNIQVKEFNDLDDLNDWLKNFQGEIIDIKYQAEKENLGGINCWDKEYLVIYKS